MRHAALPEELLEVLRQELRAVVADDPRRFVGEPLARPLDDRRDVVLGHRLADLPVDDRTAVAVQNAAHIVERTADIQIRDVDMPVAMRGIGLVKALPLAGGFRIVTLEQARPLEDAVYAGGADRHDVRVEHHVGQPAVAFQRMLPVELDDRPLLPAFQPVIARNPAVVLVRLAVALFPTVKRALLDADPADEPLGRDLRPLAPSVDVVDDLIACFVGNPDSLQSSPSSFFN